MGKVYVGVSSVARRVKKIYVGVNNVARQVKKIYVGVNGVARLVYPEIVSIPKMTSNTAPSGTASCSSKYQDSATYDAWHAFDRSSSTRWTSVSYVNDNGRWVKYDFGYEIQPYDIYVKNYVSNNAYAFVIEASKNNSSWTRLVNQSSNTATVDKHFTINTTETYRYFRYRCTNGENTYRAGVYQFNVTGYRY